MANNGDLLFSKKLSETDVCERLHWPSRHLNILPFGGNDHQQVDFNVKDLDGHLWRFRYSKRTARYEKPVISSGWMPFVNSKGGLKAGDEVIFYQNNDVDEALFVVSVKRKVPLFGWEKNKHGCVYDSVVEASIL